MFELILFFLYMTLVPLIYIFIWEETYPKVSFIKWFFKKPYYMNWVGYTLFVLLGLGCFFYIALFYLFYYIFKGIVLILHYLITYLIGFLCLIGYYVFTTEEYKKRMEEL